MDGFLIINKPLHYSSMDVIRVLRKLSGIKKIGHAGTLDPLATGVLLVCLGRQATKQVNKLMDMEKEYVAEINLTAFSETDDAQGPLKKIGKEHIPTEEEIKKCLTEFTGIIEQIPPYYSAVKIKGEAAYKKARRGEKVELKAKKVTIKSIELLSFEWPILKIRVICSKGFYIRSIARDICTCLDTGGYLDSLTRTRMGDYSLEQAVDLKQLQENRDLIANKLINIS